MNLVTRQFLSRRALVRGAGGAAMALPFLDAMRPALAGPAEAGSKALQARRVAVVYVPNGIIMNQWLPQGTGRGFRMARVLKPLERHRSHITQITGLSNPAASGSKGGAHAKASGSFLSAAQPKHTAGADVRAGVTFDQLLAQRFAAETRVPSLQLGCEDSRMVGNCDTGSSCAYTNTLSWKNAETPLAVEVNPRSVFERLFGTMDPSLDAATRRRRELYRKSILDLTRHQTQSLTATLGATDRRKMDEYLTSIREVETRIARAEKEPEVPMGEKPSGIPFEFREYVKLMFDLQVIAFQADLTRVSTMMIGREGSVRTYPEIGVPDPHHPLTHHRNHPDFIEKVTKINEYHVELFAYFIERLEATRDGDGSLLDKSAILYGGALSDGNGHSNDNLPLLLAGHAGGIRGGAHIAAAPKTPVSNLFLTMMGETGSNAASFGDSTGRLEVNV
ncbi:MAG: DUF1552 domain-containing protein [Acidobacteria bacterium]|nr:DUF1552 domain-containing protein [Acidobacteriota bacterium]